MIYSDFYVPIQQELAQVEVRLREFLASENPFIDRVVNHGFQLGGKRMRPALLLLFARMAGEICPEHEVLATAIETIHTATLVHDDILDEADTRRHLPTINKAWNNETSVLLGDFMLARAIRSVLTLKNSTFNEIIAEMCCRLCEGEMRQVGTRGDFALSEETYLKIICDKTAALCEGACRLGVLAVPGASDAWADAATTFGRCLGLAFQIADDQLDLFGEEASMGKSLGTDLEKQKMTLPMIRLLAALEPAKREAMIQKMLQNGPTLRSELQQILRQRGIEHAVNETAERYVAEAIQALDAFPDCAARQSLVNMARYAIHRTV